MKPANRILLSLCLLVGLDLSQVKPAPGQVSPASVPQAVPAAPNPGASQNEESGKKTEDKANVKEERKHRGAILIAPLPIVSPAIGSGIIPVVGYIFPFQEKDKLSPPSVIGAAGLFTNNGSRAFALGGELFMKEDRYELKSAYMRGNLNYDLYGVGFANGNAGLKLPLVQTGQIFFVEVLRNVGWKIFVGPRFITGNSLITVNPAGGETPPIRPDTGLQTNLRSIGVEALRDSRPNRFYPTRGMLLDFTRDFFSQGLGSKYSFSPIDSLSTNIRASGTSRYWPTTCSSVARVGRHRSTAIASTARIANCADTRRGVIWTDICSQRNWNTGWICVGV
jgi:hypothetical protein